MALKYRIQYDKISPHKHNADCKKTVRFLYILLIFAVIILLVISPSGKLRPHNLLLPGDPNITSKALRELSVSLDRGEELFDALDAFCQTIMDVQ